MTCWLLMKEVILFSNASKKKQFKSYQLACWQAGLVAAIVLAQGSQLERYAMVVGFWQYGAVRQVVDMGGMGWR